MHEAKMMVMGVIIAVVFTVTLSENLETVDAFSSQSTANWRYNLSPGESGDGQWVLFSGNYTTILQFSAKNPGSEFFIFEKDIIMEPNERREFDFIVSIPKDHPDNVQYRVDLFAREIKPAPEGGAAVVIINYEMVARPIINIGDNPVYTSPTPPVVVEEEPTPQEEIPEGSFSVVEEKPLETIADKLEKIKAANEANEVKVDDTLDESSEKEVVAGYIAEPVMDTLPVVKQIVQEAVQEEEGGGCLIATAAFGSEMAPQVQLLREIRDNQLRGTSSGIAFMSAFNQLYYSFSPYIADMERDSPIFKETIKLTLTPMLSTLSVMKYADSEESVLGLGIGVILMNLGMYVGLPVFGIVKLIQFRKK